MADGAHSSMALARRSPRPLLSASTAHDSSSDHSPAPQSLPFVLARLKPQPPPMASPGFASFQALHNMHQLPHRVCHQQNLSHSGSIQRRRRHGNASAAGWRLPATARAASSLASSPTLPTQAWDLPSCASSAETPKELVKPGFHPGIGGSACEAGRTDRVWRGRSREGGQWGWPEELGWSWSRVPRGNAPACLCAMQPPVPPTVS